MGTDKDTKYFNRRQEDFRMGALTQQVADLKETVSRELIHKFNYWINKIESQDSERQKEITRLQVSVISKVGYGDTAFIKMSDYVKNHVTYFKLLGIAILVLLSVFGVDKYILK